MRMRDRRGGQALTEFALVFPIMALLIFGMISFGFWVFYQQQLSNAVREAARYAAVHSASAQCPTVSHRDPQAPPNSYKRCDAPADGWPRMVGAGRAAIWGMNPASVSIVGCWSGWVDPMGNDAPPGAVGATYTPCTISGQTAEVSVASLPCPVTAADASDTASDVSYASGTTYETRITVYACVPWSPPMAGFLLIPSTVTLRAGITEIIQRQQ